MHGEHARQSFSIPRPENRIKEGMKHSSPRLFSNPWKLMVRPLDLLTMKWRHAQAHHMGGAIHGSLGRSVTNIPVPGFYRAWWPKQIHWKNMQQKLSLPEAATPNQWELLRLGWVSGKLCSLPQ